MAEGLVGKTHQSILEKEGLELLLSSSKGKVLLSSIDQKTTCLFFSANWCRPCRNFTPQLIELYHSINVTGKKLEIILISSDRDEPSFRKHIENMPWLVAPFDTTLERRLRLIYKIDRLPSLIPLAWDGNTVEEDAVQLVEDYGVDAFPFGSQRREELKVLDEAKLNGGSIVDLLGSSKRAYVISKDGCKVPIGDLVGKTVGLFFGAHWCPPCSTFTNTLMEAYNELQVAKKGIFEIVFVSADRDQEEFDLSLSSMPWLAVPYSDKTRHDLTRIFSIKGIPTLVLLGPDGKKIDSDGKAMISAYGARAFPFTNSRASEVEAALRKEAEGLPHIVMDSRHPHVLKLDMAKAYVCDSCSRRGRFWAFSCDKCNYDLHPTCVEQI